jgi:hypothetical protein
MSSLFLSLNVYVHICINVYVRFYVYLCIHLFFGSGFHVWGKTSMWPVFFWAWIT